jgi:beta-lactamase class A
MITPDTPLNQPLNYTAEVRLGNSPLDRNDYSQVVKEIYLRHLVDGSIKQNESQHITTGVEIYDMQSKRTIVSHNADKEQFAASINKLPVSLLLLEDLRANKVAMDQMITWTADDRRGGFGDFDTPDSPLKAPLRDLVYDMLNHSGNTALRVIVNNALYGPQAVNDRLETKPQLSHTRLQLLDETHFYLGNSTPHDSLWAMQQLMAKQDRYAKFMKDAMSDNIFTDFGVRSQLGDSDYALLVNKIGLLDDVEGNNRHDVGIIYNKKNHKSYAYALMTTAPYDENDTAATVQADRSLKDMGQYMLRYAGGLRSVAGPGGATTHHTVEQRIHY